MTPTSAASSRPPIDVGVVTWNTAELTARALRALLDSDQGCSVRVLVRDNGSTDGTPEVLKELVPEAEVDAGEVNLGFAAGVNTLIARSTAPWLMLLNSDAWPEPGALGALVRSAQQHPRAAAIAPRLERPDGTLEHSTFPFPSLRIAAIMAFRRHRLSEARADALMLEGAWKHDRPRQVDWAVGAALLLRREAIESLGWFDESFFMYVEDVEWCWRASRQGWEIWFEPDAIVRHVGNASGEQRYGSRRTATYMANTFRFFAREHGRVAAAGYRGLTVAGCALRYLAARRANDEAESAYWRGMLASSVARLPPE